MTRPNLLVIMADQLAPHFCGTYAHPIVKTPYMDELASQGMLFNSAYCNAPLCAPSRFSFMSGQLISRIAGYDNGSEFKASIPTFAHALRRAGYRTCLSGKMHFVGPDQLHGFEQRLTTDIYPADHAWTPDWEAPDERIDKWYHNMDAVKEAGTAATTFQLEYDEETAFFARRKLMEYALNKTQPFAMVASFIHPHDPYVCRPEWWNLYEHDEIDLPDTNVEADPHTLRLRVGIQADTEIVNEQHIRNARHAYYANVSYFDSKVGQLVNALREANLYNNTVIVVTSDHGDMLGERGLWYKMSFFEQSARVPLIISGPNVKQGVCSEPVSLVDLYPTFVDLASTSPVKPIDQNQTLDGQSLLPVISDRSNKPFIGEAIGEYCAECASHPIFMIRRGEFKYIHCDIDPPQLYNIRHDPKERKNLAGNPNYTELTASFAAEITDRWDSEAIRKDVIRTQQQRRAVHSAMQQGELTSWDYQPKRDASQEFVRNHIEWTELSKKSRYPPVH